MVNSSSRSGRKVIWVCVHTAEGIRKASDLRAFFERSTNSSAHAVADDATLLDNLVSYSQAAWTLRSGNPASDNLELCGFASWSRNEWLTNHKGMLNNAASWVRARCLARGIPIRKLDAAGVRRGDAGVIGHVDYTNGTGDGTHWDPGPGYPWDVVLDKARAYANGIEPEGFLMALTDDEQKELLEAARYLKKNGEGDRFIHEIPTRVANIVAGVDVDEQSLAAALAPSVVAALGKSHGITAADVEAAMRRILADAATA